MKTIFIGGCDRSGTTMLGSMLGAYPGYLCTPESYFKFELFSHFERHKAEIETFRDWLLSGNRLSNWGVNLREVEITAIRPSIESLLGHVLRCYGQKVGKAQFDVWIDHSPANISYADQLFELYPNAKIVHIVRDGRAVAASLLKVDWGPNSILEAAQFWCRRIAAGLAAELKWGAHKVIRIYYEDLLRNPEATLRELCERADLRYCPSMPSGAGFKPEGNRSYLHSLVGQAPSKERINAWNQILSPREIELFEWSAREMLTYLGYQTDFGLNACAPSRAERLRYWLRSIALKPGHFITRTRGRLLPSLHTNR